MGPEHPQIPAGEEGSGDPHLENIREAKEPLELPCASAFTPGFFLPRIPEPSIKETSDPE